MKGLILSTGFVFGKQAMRKLLCVTLVLAICGTLNCSCPEHMLDYKNKCISFNKEQKTYHEAETTCKKDHGNLAGNSEAFDLILAMNSNSHFKTPIPTSETTRYWAKPEFHYRSAMEAFWHLFSDLYLGECPGVLLYDGRSWSSDWSCIHLREAKLQYFCEFDKPQQEQGQRKYSTGVVIARKQSTGRCRGVSPTVETRVPSISICMRICEKATDCDTANFNPSTRECIGYTHGKCSGYENTPGWEIWSFVVTLFEN